MCGEMIAHLTDVLQTHPNKLAPIVPFLWRSLFIRSGLEFKRASRLRRTIFSLWPLGCYCSCCCYRLRIWEGVTNYLAERSCRRCVESSLFLHAHHLTQTWQEMAQGELSGKSRNRTNATSPFISHPCCDFNLISSQTTTTAAKREQDWKTK